MMNSDASKGEFMLHNGGVTLAKNPARGVGLEQSGPYHHHHHHHHLIEN
jgi:hypothetical protein